jgi:hypothetical protein
MKEHLRFAFYVSLVSTIVLGLIEWHIPGFVSYVFPFPILLLVTAMLAVVSTHRDPDVRKGLEVEPLDK